MRHRKRPRTRRYGGWCQIMAKGGRCPLRSAGREIPTMALADGRCAATRRDGSRCQAAALVGTALCFAHCPQAEEGRLKGAKTSAQRAHLAAQLGAGQPYPSTLRPVLRKLLRALDD